MPDRMEIAVGAAAGLIGAVLGMGLLQTLTVLLLTHAIHGFVLGWMGWDEDRDGRK